MNYYNPYAMMVPYTANTMMPAKAGLFSNLIGGMKGIKWGTILTNTQRTLGLINQAIPVVKQVTPVVKNAKTMFRVMNEFKKVDEPTSTINQTTFSENKETMKGKSNDSHTPIASSVSYNEPTFFI